MRDAALHSGAVPDAAADAEPPALLLHHDRRAFRALQFLTTGSLAEDHPVHHRRTDPHLRRVLLSDEHTSTRPRGTF